MAKSKGTILAGRRLTYALDRLSKDALIDLIVDRARTEIGEDACDEDIADLVQMFVAAIENQNLSGTFNAVAPNPVTNAEFMRELRRALHRPWSPPAPEFAVRLGARLMGSEPSLALVSQRCAPKRFAEAGFGFQYPQLAPALTDLCRKI